MDIELSAKVLWILWILLLVVTLFMTSILAYHWRPHRIYAPRVNIMANIFYIVTGILLFGSACLLIVL